MGHAGFKDLSLDRMPVHTEKHRVEYTSIAGRWSRQCMSLWAMIALHMREYLSA